MAPDAPLSPNGSGPSAEEAAAIMAAVERFLAETAAVAPAASGPLAVPRLSPWKRAALFEGVEYGPGSPIPWDQRPSF